MPDNPIPFKKWRLLVPRVKARKPKSPLRLRLASVPIPPRLGYRYRHEIRGGKNELVAIARRIGEHYFPASIKTVPLRKQRLPEVREANLAGFRPTHLEQRALPAMLPRSLMIRKKLWTRRPGEKDKLGEPTTVFPPDTRYVFSDTSFPWSTCGRVDTAAAWGSGVMIGPRHLMTANHVVNWGAGNTAGWLKFTPLYFDGSEPFGFAYATLIYWWRKVNGSDGIDSNETAFDYVVCVLDTRLGDITGWMGSRGYSSSWNGGAYWAHVGYPGDIAGGQRPVFCGKGVMDSSFAQSAAGRTSLGILHKNDVWPGQSGGPFFGWWENEPWPRVVSSQSAQNWGQSGGPNSCGGGNPLPELINYARNAFP